MNTIDLTNERTKKGNLTRFDISFFVILIALVAMLVAGFFIQ